VPKFHARLKEERRFETPEFFEANGFYTVAAGGQSCYGDQILQVAEHLVACAHEDAPLSLDALVDRLDSAFNASSPYGAFPLDPNVRPELPIAGPWRHGSIKGFLNNLADGKRTVPLCGADDYQADCFAKAVPLACAFAGRPEMLVHVESVVRSTQDTDEAVAFGCAAARVLEACILGHAHSAAEAIEVVAASLPEDAPMRNGMLGPRRALSLVNAILEMEPPTFAEGVAALGQQPEMHPGLGSPLALVA